ncbi:MAG: hypothetical protein ACRBBU_03165 [Pseudooceanicola sp.]
MTGPAASRRLDDRIAGPAVVILTTLVIWSLWGGPDWVGTAAALLLPAVIALQAIRVRAGRLIFFIVAIALFFWAVLRVPDWTNPVMEALDRGAFIAAYFAALATLRHAADTSPSIKACGHFLAHQPPGRRYLALSIGAHLFALLLNYGAIGLLGNLAGASAATEPDPAVRDIRKRRMLVAIQRGFGSMLPWSPLAFAAAISTTLIPGVSWAKALPYAVVSSFLLLVIGWGLDTIFKPRLPARPAPPHTTTAPVAPPAPSPTEGWRTTIPLAVLLVLLMSLTVSLHLSTGLRVTAIILPVVPLIAIGWVALQGPAGHRAGHAARRAGNYVRVDLPPYRDEILLMACSGFIGSLGAVLLGPLIAASGLDLTQWPVWAVPVLLVWLIPLTGQLGANPLLSVMLIYPIVPSPETLGVTPTTLFIAVTAGWSITATSAPFTATALLLGRFAGVSPFRVSWGWNGAYSLVSATALTIWVIIMAESGMG